MTTPHPQADILRIKPNNITINGHDFPEPVREPLVDGTRYWFVSLEPNYGGAVERTWFSGVWDEFMLNNGLAHYTKEGAIAQAKAMLSLVSKKEVT